MKSLFALLVAITLVASGCGQSTTVQDPVLTDSLTPASVTLCKDCGQVKGSETCCSDDAETCHCGFHKGSPACCKADKTGEDITLCAKCGEVAGGEKCCAEGAEVCDCGMHKGSPGCCLKTDDDEGHEEDHDGEEGHDHDGEDHDDE